MVSSAKYRVGGIAQLSICFIVTASMSGGKVAQLGSITVLDLTSLFQGQLNSSKAFSSDADGKRRVVGHFFVSLVQDLRYCENQRGSAEVQPPLIPS